MVDALPFAVGEGGLLREGEVLAENLRKTV